MDREYTEEPATHPADLGTSGAMRLGSAILGLLLLQGKMHVPVFSSKPPLLLPTPSPSCPPPPQHVPIQRSARRREIPEPFHERDGLAWRTGITTLVKQTVKLLGYFLQLPHRVWPLERWGVVGLMNDRP